MLYIQIVMPLEYLNIFVCVARYALERERDGMNIRYYRLRGQHIWLNSQSTICPSGLKR